VRKSGIPEGTETPAPVSATMQRDPRTSSASRSTATASYSCCPSFTVRSFQPIWNAGPPQPPLPSRCSPITPGLPELTTPLAIPERQSAEEHGEVFTRRWVVELILNLVGYSPERDLVATTALEPACGRGAFVVPMAERLIQSAANHGRALEEAMGALVAFDLIPDNVEQSRLAIRRTLTENGIALSLAKRLARRWIGCDDFLLNPPPERSVDFALGNPPYLRLEAVSRER